MKKIICMLTALTLTFGFGLNAYAESTVNKEKGYFTQNYTDSYHEITIPVVSVLNSEDDITTEQLCEEFDLQSETAQTVLDYLAIASDEESDIEIDAIKVLIPKEENARYSSKRTYKGYGNKQYYEETVQVDAHSDIVAITSSQNISYIDKTLTVIAEFGVDSAINSQTCGFWSLAKSLGQALGDAGVSSTTGIEYKAALYESKFVKHTYVDENNQKYFGAKTEASDAEFENYAQTSGASGKLIKGKREACDTVYTEYYSKPDRKAYNTYLSGGFTESIDRYKYNGKRFRSI